MSRLELHGLTKRFPGSTADALRAVDLVVEHGTVVGLVGSSGSGKTTLLRLVAGLETPTAGSVLMDDALLSTPQAFVPPEKRGVGLVFQDYALFPHLTVRRNIMYGMTRLKRAARSPRADELIELVGLSGFGDRYPHELSGGQRQRVALARALAPAPGVLLLDEPFSNLDVRLKAELREELRRILLESATTAIVVVHDAEDVLALADRTAILKEGELWQQGTPRELYDRPRDAYVAHFFGTTNLVRASARDGGYTTPLGNVPAAHAIPLDGDVTLSIRPADIEICASGAPAEVRRVAYRGGFLEVTLAMPGSGDEALEIVCFVPPASAPTVGTTVHVRVRGGAVQVVGP